MYVCMLLLTNKWAMMTMMMMMRRKMYTLRVGKSQCIAAAPTARQTNATLLPAGA